MARLDGMPGAPVGNRKSNRRARSDSARPTKVEARRQTNGRAHNPKCGRRRRATRPDFHACAASPAGIPGLMGSGYWLAVPQGADTTRAELAADRVRGRADAIGAAAGAGLVAIRPPNGAGGSAPPRPGTRVAGHRQRGRVRRGQRPWPGVAVSGFRGRLSCRRIATHRRGRGRDNWGVPARAAGACRRGSGYRCSGSA